MEEIKIKGKIYIIGDLHLSLNENTNKSMEVFGDKWIGYIEKIKENWKKKITKDDVVIVSGDISWGMTLEESLEDLKFLNDLPGLKLLLKGNHDYWWESKRKMENFFEKHNLNTFKILYNNSYNINGINIYGTKGWSYSEEGDFKNLRREGIRLKISGDSFKNENRSKEEQSSKDKNINICIMHYPPFLKEKDLENIKKLEEFTKEEMKNIDYINIMKEYNTKICFYAHLHGKAHRRAFEGNLDGINYYLVSGDYLDFDPVCINDKIEEIKENNKNIEKN